VRLLLLLSILDSTIVQKSLARVAENVNLGISGVYIRDYIILQ